MSTDFPTPEELQVWLDTFRTYGGDTTNVEVKAAQGGLPENLAETTAAFANMPEGGLIILGVAENQNFSVLGVDKPAELEQALVSQAHNSITPPPFIRTTVVTLQGKNLVLARVHGLNILDRPAMYQGKAYLRQADGEYEIPASELRMIEVAKLHAEQEELYDRRPVPDTTIEDLDGDLHQQFLRTARASIARLREIPEATLLRNLVVTNGDVLSIAGFYALGHFPQGPLPSLAITVAVRLPETERPRRTRNLATFYGPVPALLNQTMDWVEANIPQTQTYQESGHMRSVPVIPLAAIREAVANALIHRDLGPNTVEAGKAIDVRITPDRLIITSPGGLKNLTVAQLYSADFRRIEVNQHLYRLAKLLTDTDGNRIIEGEGGGVNAMFELCESAGLPQPKIIDTGVKVTVIFFFPKQGHTSGDAPMETPAPKTAPNNGAELEDNASFASLGNGIQVSDDHYLRSLGKNVPRILSAARNLAAPPTPVTPQTASAPTPNHTAEFSFHQLVAESGLSNSQVRYGLSPLLEHKIIVRKGGQGKKATTYQLGKRG